MPDKAVEIYGRIQAKYAFSYLDIKKSMMLKSTLNFGMNLKNDYMFGSWFFILTFTNLRLLIW